MAKRLINTDLLLAMNPEYAQALGKGESWALEHAQLCDSLNKGEPEGFRRKFDGNYHKWCGGSCPFKEGCMTCALPENEEVTRDNKKFGRSI